MNTVFKISLSFLLYLLASSSFAIDYHVSGFASLYAGKVIDGKGSDYFVDELEEENCPCFISNYYDATYYTDDKVEFDKDSTYGLKLGVDFTDWLSINTQIEGLGGNDFKPELTWLYASFKATENWTIDVGRKALPLYYYSDFLNVRYAMPWVRVPGDIYGWPLVSYNGISTSFMGELGDGHYRVSAWLGEEEDKDNRAYGDIYWAADDYIVEWSEMVGLSFEVDFDWITARIVAMTSKATEEVKYETSRTDSLDEMNEGLVIGDADFVDDTGLTDTEVLDIYYTDWIGAPSKGNGWGVVSDNVTSNFYGISFNIDKYDVLFQFEANAFDADDYTSTGYAVALGYRIGSVTPMIGYSSFKDKDPDFGRQINTTTSLVVRWDFMKSMAFKAQYDFLNDNTDWDGDNFTGNSQVVTMGVDYVF